MADHTQSVASCGALQAITEQILGNVKLSTPALEETLKAAKQYQASLEQAASAGALFVEAITRVATAAGRARGATSDLGQSFQQLVSKHHEITMQRQIQARKMADQFVTPLQKRLKSDAKAFPKIEDDFKSATKTFKSELKKLGQATVKAQKTAAKKGDQEPVDDVLRDMQRKSKDFEAFHQRSLRAVMIEERRRYCYLVDNYASVFDIDFHTQEHRALLEQTVKLTHHPEKLPASSEQVIEQNSSNGVMYEAPSPDSISSVQPSALTREFTASMKGRAVPPGCPPGGLASIITSSEQINPRATGL